MQLTRSVRKNKFTIRFGYSIYTHFTIALKSARINYFYVIDL